MIEEHKLLSGTKVAAAIKTEVILSFLGLGVQAPTATWGNMLDQAYHHLETEPWLWFFPGALILLTVLAINFLGDGLRDALDPRLAATFRPSPSNIMASMIKC